MAISLSVCGLNTQLFLYSVLKLEYHKVDIKEALYSMISISFQLNFPSKSISSGKMLVNGGINSKGDSFGFTNFYMTKNGTPFIPVVGEFHFSRFSYLYWEEELLKMKAGGVHVIATYVFWNFHEEIQGHFEWGGDRNLRHFIDLCSKHQLHLVLRIGPFCHGEVRNGGIPDWVFDNQVEIRSNDTGYLLYVKRLYREIAKQMKGSLFQEGGPVIAIQLENEFMHCGAPFDAWGYKSGVFLSSGKGGNEHLAELRLIAVEAGISPLFFTATAWGGAAVPEENTLPMLAGYAYTPWIPNQPPSLEFIYRDLHVSPSESVNFDTIQYPVAYCEMAGGMQVSYHARPFVPAESIEAMTLVKLASGSNLLGYYMYHGGSNPVGKKTYLNETSLPKITYDYQSPLGEFGRIGASYDRIRAISLFLEAFGSILAPMATVLPEGQSNIEPTDTESLRWCIRQQKGAGFLFLNNFQDHVEMPERDFRIELSTQLGLVQFPRAGSLKLMSGSCVILPFNLNLGELEIISSTAQLLTRLEHNGERIIVFYAQEGLLPEIIIRKNNFSSVEAFSGTVEEDGSAYIITPAVGKRHQVVVTSANGEVIRLLTLTRSEALQAYRFQYLGQDTIAISSSQLIVKDGQLICSASGQNEFTVSLFPLPSTKLQASQGGISEHQDGIFLSYDLKLSNYEPKITVDYSSDRFASIAIDTTWPAQIYDMSLNIEYDGDVAAAYLNDRLLSDHIHYGHPWHIGLKQFKDELDQKSLQLSIIPLRKGTIHTFVNQAFVERFEGIEIAKFHKIQAVPHYRTALSRIF